MEMKLNGRVCVITGGSRGLGFAIAKAYAREGASVVIASRSQSSVDDALTELRTAGATAAGTICDVSEITQVEQLAEYAIDTFGRIDVWVNNAGISAPYGPSAHIPTPEFLKVINTNIIGTYNGSIVAMRYFVRQKSGKLINLLGRGDTGSVKFQNAYSSSKVWVRNFTKALAAEYRGSGVGVYGFNPGLVYTEMLGQVHAVAGFESQMSPLKLIAGVWGNEADVPAEKAVWLASDATLGKTGLMVTMLTPVFMLKRIITSAFRWIFRQPVKLLELNISVVKPVEELAPVFIDKR